MITFPYIYETKEQQFAVVIPFIKIGLEHGGKCMYIVDDNTNEVFKIVRSTGIFFDQI